MTARLGLTCWAMLLAGLTMAHPARAAVTVDNFALHTAADLAALCTANPTEPLGTAAQNFCQGFSTGVFRVLYDIGLSTGHSLFCLPLPNPTRTEVVTAFSAWVAIDPARMASPAEDALFRFLTTQYSCDRTRR